MDTYHSVWNEYGYRESIFSPDPIKAQEDQRKLLVGRENELARIKQQLRGGASVVSLEGDYGVGKTSLASAVMYDLECLNREGGPLFLPWVSGVDLYPGISIPEFEFKVLLSIAATLIQNEDILKSQGRRPSGIKELIKWVQSPLMNSSNWQAGINVLSYGGQFGVGQSKTLNETSEFEKHGLSQFVQNMLNEVFPDKNSGGILCLLDNFESVKERDKAKEIVETLRDSLFKRNGLRWIVSGAEGFVQTSFSSPKLFGVFSSPIQVSALPEECAVEVVKVRESWFKMEGQVDVNPPMSDEAFSQLFVWVGKGLRFALSLCEDYVLSSDPQEIMSLSLQDRDKKFFTYIRDNSRERYKQFSNPKTVTKADWKVFEKLVSDKSGACSPSEYRDFGYENMSPLLVRVRRLEKFELIKYSVDEEDGRRRQIEVSEFGRYIYLHRRMAREAGEDGM
ncbi:ATP-binding protein [Actinomyces naeslundii]|uniref:ATP-binding protein n=1 Tax=Actinomyces naeslundii TaxID=1655 RepID=UPI0011781C6E|nr:ATP-binding protein [Actinomyces naeslundii]